MQSNNKTFRAGLIGLGQVAAGYGSPEETAPYCHAGGLARSAKVKLVAAAELFPQARTAFTAKWGAALPDVTLYEEAEAMLKSERLDIVGVCVRGPWHFETMRALLGSPHAPRAIFLEKPPFCSLQEADEIVALAEQKGVSITVSYSRHWAPHVLKLQELVRDGLIGEVRSVVGYCGQEAISFASHTTDLICQFACPGGTYRPLAVTAAGEVKADVRAAVPAEFAARGFEPEPWLHWASIEFAGGVTGLQVGQKADHDQFYVDVFGSKGRVRAGIYLPPAAWDAANQPMDLAPHNFPPDASVFTGAYDQIADFLRGGPEADCSGANWQAVNEIGFGAVESMSGAGRVELPNRDRTRRVFANQ